MLNYLWLSMKYEKYSCTKQLYKKPHPRIGVGKHYENFRGPQNILVEPIWRCVPLSHLAPQVNSTACLMLGVGKHYENFRGPQNILVEPIWRCFGQKITPVGRFWVPFRRYKKIGFPYYWAKKEVVINFIYGYPKL